MRTAEVGDTLAVDGDGAGNGNILVRNNHVDILAQRQRSSRFEALAADEVDGGCLGGILRCLEGFKHGLIHRLADLSHIVLAALEHALLGNGDIIGHTREAAAGLCNLAAGEDGFAHHTVDADLLRAFGPDRRISLCRELTKLHEEVIRTTLQGAVDYYKENAPRGEYVLILEGAEPPAEQEISMEDALAMVVKKIESGLSKKDAVKQVAKDTGLSKNTLYDEAMKL